MARNTTPNADHDRVDDVQVHVRGVGERGAHPLVHVDERVDQHDRLQPVPAAHGDRRELGPRVVGAAQERDRQDDEAEHQADVPRLEAGAEHQAEAGHRDAGQRHERHDDPPVQGQVGLHPGRVHDRGDGQHDDRGQHALGRAGQHLLDRHQPDRAGRLDPVLDLAGEAELLGHGQGDGLHALEHDRDADHARDQDGGEGRLLGRARGRRCPARSSGTRRGTRSRAGTAG